MRNIILAMCLSIIVSVACVPFSVRGWGVAIARGTFTFFVMNVWGYWVHRISHSEWGKSVPLLRLHALLHHREGCDEHAEPGKLWGILHTEDVLLEAAGNIFFIGVLVWVFRAIVPGVHHLLSVRGIAFYTLSYTAIHNFNYHLPAYSDFHSKHHEHPQYNHGVCLMDAMFGTCLPGDTPEDMTHYIPTMAIVACVIVIVCSYRPKTLENTSKLEDFLAQSRTM